MKSLLSLIEWPVVFIAFSVGLAFVYIWMPTPNVIFIYPNPDNLDRVYEDSDQKGACFKYDAKEVSCKGGPDSYA